jgi:hypothetical protein
MRLGRRPNSPQVKPIGIPACQQSRLALGQAIRMQATCLVKQFETLVVEVNV